MSDFTFDPPPETYHEWSAYLVIERGPAPDKRYDITAVTNTLGRSPGNEIVIHDPEISRRHAQIVQQEHGFAIEDMGSTNGTFVNGQRCAGLTSLRAGDRIELGDTVSLIFHMAAPMATTSPDPDDEDTADLPPVKVPVAQSRPSPPGSVAADQYLRVPPNVPPDVPPDVLPSDARPEGRTTRMVLGCGLAAVLLLCCCGALVIFLDSYNQGQYLYCGGLRPLWEVVLSPLGFNPGCP